MGVVVLAGPSGSGKSRLAARLGWPVLRLDDFYREHHEPAMAQNSLGIIGWDPPESLDNATVMTADTALCHAGVAAVPVYAIGRSERVGVASPSAPDGRFVAKFLASFRRGDAVMAAQNPRDHSPTTVGPGQNPQDPSPGGRSGSVVRHTGALR